MSGLVREQLASFQSTSNATGGGRSRLLTEEAGESGTAVVEEASVEDADEESRSAGSMVWAADSRRGGGCCSVWVPTEANRASMRHASEDGSGSGSERAGVGGGDDSAGAGDGGGGVSKRGAECTSGPLARRARVGGVTEARVLP